MLGRRALIIASAVALLTIPTVLAAGPFNIDYLSNGTGVLREFDQDKGYNWGVVSSTPIYTFTALTPFHIIGAIAQDDTRKLTHDHEPLAICVGDITKCDTVPPKGTVTDHFMVMNFHTVSVHNETDAGPWPAGTTVTFFVMSAAVDTSPAGSMPGTATTGHLLIWSS